MKEIIEKRLVRRVLFFLYLVFLMKVIIFKYPTQMMFDVWQGNIMPFKTILPYMLGQPTWSIALRNIFGNIIPFIPIGFVPYEFHRMNSWKKIIAISLAVGMFFEGVQCIFRMGIFDIDDIILNACGVCIGYGIFGFIKNHVNKKLIDK